MAATYGARWGQVLPVIKQKVENTCFSANCFDNWFGDDTITGVTRNKDVLTIWTADEYARIFMRDCLADIIKEAILEVAGADLYVSVRVDKKAAKS